MVSEPFQSGIEAQGPRSVIDSQPVSESFACASQDAGFGAYDSHLHPLFRTDPLADTATAHVIGRRLGQAIVLQVRMDACALEHSKDELLNSAAQMVGFVLVGSGSLTLEARGRSDVIGPGDIGLLDFVQSFAGIAEGLVATVLLVPRVRVPLVAGNSAAHLREIASEGPELRLASEAIEILASVDRKRDPTLFVEMVMALLNALLRPATPQSARLLFDRRDRSTLGKMCRYIDGNLDDHDLSAEKLAREFGVSRATVFRVFASQGGVASYIRDVRLDAAFKLLSANSHSGLRLNVLANRFGFASGDTFARAFRTRYGIRPLQMRQGGDAAVLAAELHRANRSGAETSPIDRWIATCVMLAKRTAEAA